jgi:hypothetical protein
MSGCFLQYISYSPVMIIESELGERLPMTVIHFYCDVTAEAKRGPFYILSTHQLFTIRYALTALDVSIPLEFLLNVIFFFTVLLYRSKIYIITSFLWPASVASNFSR